MEKRKITIRQQVVPADQKGAGDEEMFVVTEVLMQAMTYDE
jgi:hypothetical protein